MIISILTDNNRGGVERSLYIHETCATDTDNMKKVFEDVKVTVPVRKYQYQYQYQ